MTTRSVVAITSVSKSQLKDDVLELALANGYTQQDVERLERVTEYRKAYQARPAVIEKRKEYTRKRYLKMKALKELLNNVVAG